MKLLTYNILHGAVYKNGGIDLDLTVKTLKELAPDIAVLNEVRGLGPIAGYTDQAEYIASRLGMYYCFIPSILVGGTSPYGNAILSVYPIVSAVKTDIPDPEKKRPFGRYEHRSVLCAAVDTPRGILKVYGTHFGLEQSEQENALATVKELIKEGPAVLMGDLNTEPDSEIIRGLKEFLFDTGKLIYPSKCSYPSDKPKIKIDYIFTTEDIEVLNADIINTGYSDHLPCVAEIDLPK